jgi:peptidoglycan/LPS O-acetylase OafA/YrhL
LRKRALAQQNAQPDAPKHPAPVSSVLGGLHGRAELELTIGVSMMSLSFPRNNNLEWLRLIFATQVVLEHTAGHMGLILPEAIGHFPGVPAFFFVSGFLIYASYLNSPGRRYFANRFLRLYPGLVFVTLGGAVVTLIAHGWSDLFNNVTNYTIWFLAQTTLGQAYNPALFRDVGVGVVNGSLWTLTTEILFYVSVPIIVWMERRFRFTVIILLALSFMIYAVGPIISTTTIYRDKTFYDIIALTPVAWGWMFATGILAVKHFNHVQRWLLHMPWVVIPMTVMIIFGHGLLFGSSGNRLGLVYFFCYIGLALWFSFIVPFVRMNFDLSYGAYVWHMPIINLLLVLGIPSAPLAVGLTFVVAALSWFFVEKPALKLKRQSLKPVRT